MHHVPSTLSQQSRPDVQQIHKSNVEKASFALHRRVFLFGHQDTAWRSDLTDGRKGTEDDGPQVLELGSGGCTRGWPLIAKFSMHALCGPFDVYQSAMTHNLGTFYICYEMYRNTISSEYLGAFNTVHRSLQGPGNKKFGPPLDVSRCGIGNVSVNFKSCMLCITL